MMSDFPCEVGDRVRMSIAALNNRFRYKGVPAGPGTVMDLYAHPKGGRARVMFDPGDSPNHDWTIHLPDLDLIEVANSQPPRAEAAPAEEVADDTLADDLRKVAADIVVSNMLPSLADLVGRAADRINELTAPPSPQAHPNISASTSPSGSPMRPSR